MAEIKVEKKDNQQPIWPWIVGILLLLLVVWGLVEFFESDDEPQVATTTEVREDEPVATTERQDVAYRGGTSAEVSGFVNYVEEDEESPDMGLQHEYVSEGIQRLSAALTALADETAPDDVDVSQKKERMQQSAQRLQQDPESLQHANIIRSTFMEAADLMESIQQKSFPDMESEVADVRSSAEEIDVETPTLEQKDKVKNFFENASEVLQSMVDEESDNNQDTGFNSEMQ